MHLQDITNILGLQGIVVTKFIYGQEGTVYLTIEPTEHIQTCPYCNSSDVIRRGSNGHRRIRYLPIFQYKTIIKTPKIRMSCNNCHASFTLEYSFVTGKSRYTDVYKEYISKKVPGATVIHCSQTLDIPYSTVEKIYKDYIDYSTPILQERVILESMNTNKLILGIDDLAIRKDHTYNTGIHDLRNGTLLEIILGRKFEELRKHKGVNPRLFELQPCAVVIDLAPYYHAFVHSFVARDRKFRKK